MSDEQVDHSRRRLLTAATTGVGAVGVVFAAVPFISSWQPSARAKALGAPVAVDASKLEEGQMLKVVWRGQPVFVVRRSKAVVDALGNHNDMLADPNSDDSAQPAYIKDAGAARARNPEYWVGLAVCTHLGCSPLAVRGDTNAFQVAGTDLGQNWPGGFIARARFEVRYIRTGVQEHARSEEPDRSFLYLCRGSTHRDRRRRIPQVSIIVTRG